MYTKKTAKARWVGPGTSQFAAAVQAIKQGATVLSGVDLSGIAIGADGPVQELHEANLFKSQISDALFQYAALACSINESTLSRVDFSGSDFDRCRLGKSTVTQCDFSGTKIIANLDDSVFSDCTFDNSRIVASGTGAEYGGRRVKFVRCSFAGALLRGVEFRGTSFEDCDFSHTRFVACDLRGAKFSGSTAPPAATQFEKMTAPDWAGKD